MRNMPMCPMMMGQMPMMQEPMQMQMPMQMTMPMHMQAPMCMHMPMMEPLDYDEDDRDEEYFAGMHSENYHMMMPYVVKSIDKMEKKDEMIYDEYPDKKMVSDMADEAYKNMIKDMPEMSDENEGERQYGRRRIARDLVGALLINELLRRRRHRRRRFHDFFDHDHNHHGYGDFDEDFYYNEY